MDEIVNTAVNPTEQQVNRFDWVKAKMTVSLSKENLSKLTKFMESLPNAADIDNISKLLVYLLETTNDSDLQRKIDELESDNHILGHELSDALVKIDVLEKKQDSSKPVNQTKETTSKPTETNTETDSKPTKITVVSKKKDSPYFPLFNL